MKANASPTSPMVIAGSITRRNGFFMRNGTEMRYAIWLSAEDLLDEPKLPAPGDLHSTNLRTRPASGVTLGLGEQIGLGISQIIHREHRGLFQGRQAINRKRSQADLARRNFGEPARCPCWSGAHARTDGERTRPGGGGRNVLDLGDRHLLPALLAAPLLAGHPLFNVESRTAALTEKHDAHQSDSLIAGQARAGSNPVIYALVSRQKTATNMPRNRRVQKITPSSNLAISLK